jgi:hypothetical protein
VLAVRARIGITRHPRNCRLHPVTAQQRKAKAQERGGLAVNDTDTRQAQILDKGCYWLICIPVEPDDTGWNWKGIIWEKGEVAEKTTHYKKNVAAIEEWAAKFMRCK